MTDALRPLRYLTFEISSTCALADLHPRCAVSDPERYMFGQTDQRLDDQTILEFWRWARTHGFDGIMNWHLYNEPMPELPRIKALVAKMRAVHPDQRVHLWSGLSAAKREQGTTFDLVVHTDYRLVPPGALDNRRASTTGEGDYDHAPRESVCTRAADFELIIDNHGNWLKCCNDWRCEEAVGNIFTETWDTLLEKYALQPKIAWHNVETWAQLPRMCRACVTVNSNLHRTAVPPPGMTSW